MGEFKKFIDTIIEDTKDDSDTWGYMFGVVEKDIPAKIEEAKKEFLTLWDISQSRDLGSGYDGEYDQEYIDEIEKWFKKWFGGSQE